MLRKLPVVVIILSFLVATVFAQQATDAKVPDKEEKESVEKMAVAFLRETMSDVSAMRSAENRISFASEMAALMWFYDEKEARSMFIGVIADFRQLLDRYAAELHEMGDPELDGEAYRGGGFLSMTEPSARGRLMKKISTAVAVRQQIALSIAENDPDLAYSFFTDTSLAMESPEIQKMFASRDKYFESQLITQISEKSPAKAVTMATKSLKDGFDHQHLELLRKLHAKDADKAVEFGAAIISSLDKKTASYLINSLIDYGEETLEASRKPQGKKAVFTQSELRDLAEILAKRMLDTTASDDDDYMGNAGDYLETVEKYAPNRAAQIRAKQKRSNSGRPSVSNVASNAVTADAFTVTGSANSNSNGISPAEQRRLDQAKEEQKLLEDIGKMGSKQLPKEEREKFIANARKVINQSQSRDKKVMALSALAGQVAALGDKELAAQIMKEAEVLVNPTPKHYQDFLLTWMLASGYAAAEPDKAFPLLEETIGRANETIGAFIKVGEFIDVAEEMISDGEVQVGAFGGSMVRGLTKELGIADNTIRVLAKVDFKRTKELTNRFDRPEVRILAKMLVLRSVMNKKEPEADLAKKVEAATEK